MAEAADRPTLGAALHRWARDLPGRLAAPAAAWAERAAAIAERAAARRPALALAAPDAPPPIPFSAAPRTLQRDTMTIHPPPEVEALGGGTAPDAGAVRVVEHLLGRTFPSVRVHADAAADRRVRDGGADALAVGDRLLFRRGAFAPQQPEGLALLGHELTHVASPWRGERSRAAARDSERNALMAERTVLERLAQPTPPPPGRGPTLAPAAAVPPPAGGPAVAPAGAPPPAAPGAMPVRAAMQDRSLPPPPPPAPRDGEPRAALDPLADVKDAVYRDLMDRIRTDFERGG